jgi:transketolase C-terminal domain/subunit
MKSLALALIATLAFTAFAVPADAAPLKKYRYYVQDDDYDYYYVRRDRRRPPRQIEYDANKLPYGSRIWWEQMEREDRAGTRR